MELADLNDKQKALIDPRDRKQFGREAQTYAEAEAGACVKAHKELQRMVQSWCGRYELKCIPAPTRGKSHLPGGWPDLTIFGPNGKTLFMELKVGKDVLSREQEITHEQLRDFGHTVIVAHTYEYATRNAYAFFYAEKML
jgi:VRR-NUC domain